MDSNERMKEGEKAGLMFLAFLQLNPDEFALVDQFRYMTTILEIAEKVEPFVVKYGGSVEELQKKYDESHKQDMMQKALAYMAIKELIQNNPGNNNEEKEDD